MLRKVGDRCWIKPFKLMAEQYGVDEVGSIRTGDWMFTGAMEESFKGKNRICTISRVDKHHYHITLDGEEKEWDWSITDEMLIWPAFEYGEEGLFWTDDEESAYRLNFDCFDFSKINYGYRARDTWWKHAKPLPKEEETVTVNVLTDFGGPAGYILSREAKSKEIKIPKSEWENFIKAYRKE